MNFKNPRNAWESDPVFGSIILITFSILIPIPLVVVSSIFGRAIGPYAWVVMCVAFWAFEIWTAFKPWHKRS
jgi:hypothetical protein